MTGLGVDVEAELLEIATTDADSAVVTFETLTTAEEERVAGVTADGYATNTIAAYESRLRTYLSWLNSTGRSESATFEPRVIAAYLSYLWREAPPRVEGGSPGRSVATIEQTHAAILRVARSRNEDVTAIRNSTVIQDVMRGIRRSANLTTRPKQAHAWSEHELRRIIQHLNATPGNTAVRDKALFLLGVGTGLRGAEITALTWSDIAEDAQNRGVALTVRASKTSTLPVQIPVGRLSQMHSHKCPVQALADWREVQMKALDLTEEQMGNTNIFTRVRRGGHVKAEPISGPAVSNILRRICEESGVPSEGVSSHSMRASMATRSLANGTDLGAILATGRWSNPQILLGTYDRRDVFERGSTTDFLGGV
ncbi:tyrosine recombinase XerC [Demequina sediminis]|uniref:Tyrosine recombinase XerC n=1 Tax=Demequina sediminis TaxID=1930058 RepID=A0ABP9WF09_9MICO|nr:tyrosine-type recombinase/integrase [Demequina sediminis]BDZ62494.1 hypothetical protein GCM10025873_22850 [Demequina sediminis]